MKRTLISILLTISIAALTVGCSTTKSSNYATKDVDKMLSLITQYMKVAKKASKDSLINDKEIDKLNQLYEDLNKFEIEMEEKYSNDSVGEKLIDDYMIEKEEEFNFIYDNFLDIMFKVYECEGSEKLN